MFKTSSRCSLGGCVEIAHLADGGVVLRSTRRPHESVTLDGTEWADFRAAVLDGEFASPTEAD